MAKGVCPYDEYVGVLMSNLDHALRTTEAPDILKSGQVYGLYTAANFCGRVWWDGENQVFKCEIWVCRGSEGVMEAPTLKQLMTVVSDKYGYA